MFTLWLKGSGPAVRFLLARQRTAILFLVLLSTGSGCSHLAKSRDHAQTRLAEHSRALTTAVVDALQVEPAATRGAPAELALKLAREDQRIEGLPAKSIAVEALLPGPANGETDSEFAARRSSAERDLERRFAEIEKCLARERKADERLREFGEQFEEERNASRWRWTKGISFTLLCTGGLIALVVFCPVALPLLGRVLAWIVAKLPSLAGAIGVVSVKAFDAVVKGIERSRAPSGGTVYLKNERSVIDDSAPAGESNLALNLSREMDASHKRLVRARKGALSL